MLSSEVSLGAAKALSFSTKLYLFCFLHYLPGGLKSLVIFAHLFIHSFSLFSEDLLNVTINKAVV